MRLPFVDATNRVWQFSLRVVQTSRKSSSFRAGNMLSRGALQRSVRREPGLEALRSCRFADPVPAGSEDGRRLP